MKGCSDPSSEFMQHYNLKPQIFKDSSTAGPSVTALKGKKRILVLTHSDVIYIRPQLTRISKTENAVLLLHININGVVFPVELRVPDVIATDEAR